MKERIKKMRKELHLTQQEFADRIGIKRNTLANYETGRNEPIDAVISLICRTFHVREEWLREGIEPMFSKPHTSEAQVREWVDGIFEKGSHFEQNFVKAMSMFGDREWAMMEQFVEMVWKEQQAANAAKPPAPAEAEAPFPTERPAWLTEEQWAWLQRNRTAEAGRNAAAGSSDSTDCPEGE